ncbi:ParB/RepB/Spo0J family partition protein [Rhodovulum visakhapatnamense]|uniref:ParB family chromosome partitioning protein n=1 Tax=Rhodovulum visakhapatnamense TaxID=364297 RepID=A0A4R8F9C3_9RHOB|nr:ParB N-terminal domain-containing protein [Rhodovulum visakhapatnamense]TDX22230.1 ParB family chromosome partitioning protein [Rhodovulum visakhapatnamense]
MARRKRLGAPQTGDAAPETKAFPLGVAPTTTRRAPIAQVAGDAAALAAAEALAGEMAAARSEGRLVQALPLDRIEAGHLLRDRRVFDPEEMAALKASIAARGQQVPIEVIETGQGAYGLISGLRRLSALRELQEETGEDRFARVKALIKPLDSAPEAYIAMVEENEIRSDLSFYERARLAWEAAGRGVFDSPQAAVKALFANTTPARRSKIAAFVVLHEAFGEALRFPEAIPEKVGLALVKAHQGDAAFAARLRADLEAEQPETAAAERRVLDESLRKPAGSFAETPKAEPVATGISMAASNGRVVLSGAGVTGELAAELRAWLAARR